MIFTVVFSNELNLNLDYFPQGQFKKIVASFLNISKADIDHFQVSDFFILSHRSKKVRAFEFFFRLQSPVLEKKLIKNLLKISRVADFYRKIVSLIKEWCTHSDFDFCFQPGNEHVAKKLLIADFDKTIIDHETLDEMASSVGKGKEVEKITEQGMKGELDFTASLQKRVMMLKGHKLNDLCDGLIENIRINTGAEILINTMKKRGAKCILVSGGFSPVVEKIGHRLGFDQVFCNYFDLDSEGCLTGYLSGSVVSAETKKSVLVKKKNEMFLSNQEIVVVGDGANDLLMLEEIASQKKVMIAETVKKNRIRDFGLAIGFQAKEIVRDKIFNQINFTDLSSILYYQGIHSELWEKP